MNPFIDLSVFVVIWTLIYFVSDDIMKFVAKHLIFLTSLAALYEAIVIYQSLQLDALFTLVLVIWIIIVILDYMDAFTKPAKKMAEVKFK